MDKRRWIDKRKKLFEIIKVLNGFFLCKERYNADDKNVTDNNFGIGIDTRRAVRGKGYKKHIKKVWNFRGTDKKVFLAVQEDGEIHLFFCKTFLGGQRGQGKSTFFLIDIEEHHKCI